MKLPEYRPMPPQWNNDHDAKAAGAVFGLLGWLLLLVLSLGLVFYGLFFR